MPALLLARCAIGGLLATAAAHAQISPGPARPALESIERPGDDRLRPPARLEEGAKPRLILPPVDSAGRAQGLLSGGLRVRLSKFRFEGNTVFPAEELGRIVSRYENTEIGNAELEDARLAITRHYINAGYINSGASVPDQEVTGGIVTIRIIEGRLTGIEISGNHRFRPGYLGSRIAMDRERPLNIVRLQENLQLLLENPQIERINAELGPGANPGESILRAEVTEARRYRLGMGLANNRSPSVGPIRAEIHATANNLLGVADTLGLRLGKTEGLDDASLNYAVPVSNRDTLLTLRWDKNDSTVIEAPFRSIDIKGKSETLEIGLSHPLYRTLQRELRAGLSLATRSSETFLLGMPFSFTPGVTDGKGRISVARLSAQWVDRTPDSALALRWAWSFGLDAFGATVNSDGTPDSRFVARLGQLQWAKRLGEGRGELLARSEFQLSNGALMPLEKYAVGGMESVRGYRENLFVRDKGWNASLEYRVPVARVPIRALGDNPGDGDIKLVLFADAGHAWDAVDATGVTKTISSIGAGVRWDISADAYFHLYKGVALQNVEIAERDLQDRGIHFRFGIQKRF